MLAVVESGISGQDETVERVVLVGGGVSARIGIGDFVAFAVVGRAGDAAQRRGGLGEVAEGVVGVVGGGGGRAGVRVRQRLGHRELVAERVVGVGRRAAERVGPARHVAVGVVGELRGHGRLRPDVVADRAGLHGAVGVEGEAGQGARCCRSH